ncbi:MAG: NAD-dependent epimerase/dehydratase family protein [bacterium]
MRLLVTGATGFLGRALIPRLVERFGPGSVGALLLPGDAFPDCWRDLAVREIRGDVADAGSVDSAVAGSDAVIHAAGLVTYARRDRAALARVNVLGTRHVAAACVMHRVKRLVHISSVGALGMRRDGVPTDEDQPYNWPAGFVYMESKIAGQSEVLRRVESDGLNAVVLNPASIMGPGDPTPSSAHNRLHAFVRSSPVLPSFRGSLGVVDVRDAAEIAAKAVQQGVPGRCYLLSGSNVSYPDVLAAMARAMGLRRVVVVLPGWMLAGAGWAAEGLAAAVGRPPALAESYGRLSAWRCCYTNERSCGEFAHTYRAFETTVADGCRYYLENFA